MVCNLCKATGATSGTGTAYLSIAPECNSNNLYEVSVAQSMAFWEKDE
jgi:hypothetical protein